MFDKQEILYASEHPEKEGNYLEYEITTPAGWYAIYPLYDPKHTCTLADFGIFLNHGGSSTIRFSLDRSVPYSEHEYPKKGDALALITYFKETDNDSEEKGSEVKSPSITEET
jgi:hypothetical protein